MRLGLLGVYVLRKLNKGAKGYFGHQFPHHWRVTGANYKRCLNQKRQSRAAGRQYQGRIKQGWCRGSQDGRLRSTRDHGNTNRRISIKTAQLCYLLKKTSKNQSRSMYESTTHLSRKKPRWNCQMYCWKTLALRSPEKPPKSEGASAGDC